MSEPALTELSEALRFSQAALATLLPLGGRDAIDDHLPGVEAFFPSGCHGEIVRRVAPDEDGLAALVQAIVETKGDPARRGDMAYLPSRALIL